MSGSGRIPPDHSASGLPPDGVVDLLDGVLEGRKLRIARLEVLRPPTSMARHEDAADSMDAAVRLEATLRSAAQTGASLALVVADEGVAFYEAHGFVTFPSTEAACKVRMPAPWPKEPAWVESGDPFAAVPGLRAGGPDDLAPLIAIHREATAAQRFRIERSTAAWEQALQPIATRHAPDQDEGDRLLVVEEGGQVVAYALLGATPGVLRWREHGARAGCEARLIDLFWCALAGARRRGLDRLEGWHLPDAPGGKAYYPIARRRRDRPFVAGRAVERSLELPRFGREEECRLFELDLR